MAGMEMRAKITAVEERFAMSVVDPGKYGSAKNEGSAQEGVKQISTGYWMRLDGWPIVFGIGPSPRDFAVGDEVVVVISKGNKERAGS